MKVALIHDWLTGMRGGEYVLEAITELFRRPDLFTLIHAPNSVSPPITALRPRTSPMQRIPGAVARYRHFLPLMPWMIRRFDLSAYDLIVSSSHCVAKGIRKPAGAVHVSYVHAPMRYMWDRFDEYFGPGRAGPLVRFAAKLFRKRLQRWDRSVSGEDNVDQLVANSAFIAERIRDCYGREASVVHPFANVERFSRPREPGRNYLMVTAFAPYKRVDLAIEAFNRLKLPLVIVGGGQEAAKLKPLAGPTVDFVGGLSNAAIEDLLSKCRAFVFPGKEDFGITPLEAMGAGAPVIAYAAGGALETVTEKTGVFFHEQTVESLMEAVMRIERGEITLSEEECRARARQFSRESFQLNLADEIRRAWARGGKDPGALEESLSPEFRASGRSGY